MSSCGGCLMKNLAKVVERIVKNAVPKRKANIINCRDFIDLLNYSLENSDVQISHLNHKHISGRYGHKIEYKSLVFITTTERKIYEL